MQKERIVSALNNHSRYFRYKLIKKLRKEIDKDKTTSNTANLFLRSTYSFSSYSPSMLAYMGYKVNHGLVGLYDIETLEGAKEFVKACKLFNLKTCLGTGIRVSAHFTTGNFSSVGVIGIPENRVKDVQKFLKPYREVREDRIKKMVSSINKRLQVYGVNLSYGRDVCSLTKIRTGGTIIDRHVWLALSKKLIALFGKGDKLIEKLISMKMEFSDEEMVLLQEVASPFYDFDVARIVKEKIKVEIKVEKNHKEVIEFAHSINAFALYELRKIEKSKQEELVKKVKNAGYDVLAFNPRNMVEEEVISLVELCSNNELICLPLEIIDFPRKKFETVIKNEKILSILDRNAWAICGHGYIMSKGQSDLALNQSSFEKRLEILAGAVHPEFYQK